MKDVQCLRTTARYTYIQGNTHQVWDILYYPRFSLTSRAEHSKRVLLTWQGYQQLAERLPPQPCARGPCAPAPAP